MSRTPTNLPYTETPLVKSTPLSSSNECSIYLKYEFTQPSGSFKSRGLGYLVKESLEEARKSNKKIEFFSSSGGNAGLAASTAAKFYNLPCTVVLPTTSKLKMKRKIEDTGAKVIIHGNHWGEADSYLRDEIIACVDTSETVAVYCHPFDNELIWEGHSSMIDEICYQLSQQDLKKLKGVVCSVGGGGLYNGVVRGLIKNKLSHVPVLAIETENAPTLNSAIKAGRVVHLKSVNTIATSLASPYASAQSLEYALSHPTKSVLISDNDAAEGVFRFAGDHNVIVEPACGAALSSVYKPNMLKEAFGDLEKDDIVVVIVCGGSASGIDDVAKYGLKLKL